MKKVIFIASTLVIFIDQLIKYFILNNMNLYDNIVLIPKFLNITFVKNTGGAFSLLPGARWLFILAALIVIFMLVKYIIKDKNITKLEVVTYSIIIGGVIGNMIDRIAYSSVIDYISFSIFGYNAPIFNFADMCIVVGAFILCLLMIKGEENENNNSRK